MTRDELRKTMQEWAVINAGKPIDANTASDFDRTLTECFSLLDQSSIITKIIAIKKAVGSFAPDQENTEGRKFKYRSIDGVVNAVAQALIDQGVVIHSTSAEMLASEQVAYGQKGTLGFRTTLAVEYEWTDGESSITSAVISESIDAGDKGTAKAMSVAYRIAILQTLSLPTGDKDPDSESTGHGHEITAKELLIVTLSESGFQPAQCREIIGAALGRLITKVSDLSEEDSQTSILAIEQAIADREQLEEGR